MPSAPQPAIPAPAFTQPVAQPMMQQAPAPRIPSPPVPPPDPSVLAAMEPNEAKSYYCKRTHFTNIAQMLQQQFGSNPRVDIDVRPENSLILVWAPVSVQKEIEQIIWQMDGFENFPAGQDPRELDGTLMRIESNPKSTVTTPNVPPATFYHSPQFATLETIELKLQTIFGERMKQFPQSEEGRKRFRIAIPRPEGTYSCDLEFNAIEFRVKMTGNPNLVDQFMQLVRLIDQPSPKDGYDRRFISIQNSDPEKIRKILETYRIKSAPTGSRKNHKSKIQQVVHLVQEGGATLPNISGGGFEGMPSGAMEPGGYGAGMNFGFGPGGQEIEVIPDHETKVRVLTELDVVIIDAPMQEVSRIIKMIEQLEEISKEAIPKIEIVFLEYVNCESLNGVLPPLSRQIINVKQGRVWVLPMINPNAMLVCGWGAAKDAMIELIQNLDKPVAVEQSLLRIVRLKSVSAEYVRGVIEDLFAIPATGVMTQTGFAPRVRLMSDVRSNSLIVQAAPNDFREIERLIAELDINSSDVKIEMRTFKLTNVLAQHMVTMLESALEPAIAGIQAGTHSMLPTIQLLTQLKGEKKHLDSGFLTDVKFTANTHNNTIVVTAPSNSFELIEELIRQLDVPSALAKLKVIPIQYSDAQTLKKTLETLLPTQMAGEGGPQLPGAEGEEAFVPVRIAIDQRSNSLLVVGSEGDINFIYALVMRLDQKDAMDRTLKVITLKNQSATDVANAINKYMRQYQDVQRNSIVSEYQLLEGAIIAVPEPVSNRLIINASAAYMEEINKIVEELDREPFQAVIQVMIGEVTLSNTDEFGIELGLQDPLLFNRSLLSNIQTGTKTTTVENAQGKTTVVEEITSATNTPGFNWNNETLGNSGSDVALASAGTVAAQALSSFATGRVNSDTGFGGLVIAASSDAVSILLRAMQENSKLEVLSRPMVTAQDNQLALVFVGQEVSRVGGTTVSGSGAVQADVKSKNVGLLLGVVPRIDPKGEKVVMLISAEKSSLGALSDGVPIPSGGSGESIRSPNINQIRTETIVSAKDGETVLLGGLITRDFQTLQRRVPYLSDIPILGNLFRYDYEKCKRTELIIIMRPRIIKAKEDMDEIRRVESARMSWCLADVVKIHGDIDVYSTRQERPVTGDAPVIEPGYVDPDALELFDRPGAVNTPGSPPPPGRIPAPELAPQNSLRSGSESRESAFPQIEIHN